MGSNVEERDGCRSRLRGCFSKGCLLPFLILTIICFLTVALLPPIIDEIVAPAVEAMDLKYSGQSVAYANDYLKGEEGPLPDDVILSDELAAFAEAKGLDRRFRRYYQIQSCIAAAERENVRRQDLCALMDLERWSATSDAMRPWVYVIAVATAQGLKELGYEVRDPEVELKLVDAEGGTCEEGEECVWQCKNDTCKALLAYFGENQVLLDRFVQLSNEWMIAETAAIRELGDEDYQREAALTVKYQTLQKLGLDQLVILGGSGPIGAGGVIILPDPPPVPDGVFAHPYDGSVPVSYHWLQAVIVDGKWRIDHPGQDLARADDSGKAIGHPIVSMHNAEVTFAQMLPASWGLAAHWWISGIVVVTYTEVPGEPAMCNFYGHGAVGTLQVSVGDNVGAGKQLFNAGSTGFSSDTHLHLAIRRGGTHPFCEGGGFVDPNPYIP